MQYVWIVLGVYWLLVLAGWAGLLHFTNEKWWAAFVPIWGLYKRVKALEKLSVEGDLLVLKTVDFSSEKHEGKNVFLAELVLWILMYLYDEFLMHVRHFWKLARLAGEAAPFALGMVLCPPLFMVMLWNRKEQEARIIRDGILKIALQKEKEALEEKRLMEGPPLWKCKDCGAQWPMDRATCRECGGKRP